MDRRFHNSTPRGRGQSWRPQATTAKHCHNPADGATSDSLCEISNGSKDNVSSNGNRTSQPMSFGKKLNQFGHGKVPKYQYRQVHNSPISSGGDNINLFSDTTRVMEPVTPTRETRFFVSVSHFKTNSTSLKSRDKNVVDDGEKSGDSLHFGHLSTGSSAHRHDLNRMKRDEAKRAMEGQKIIKLRCGMILLKHYISFNDQVKIVKECRDLGKGPGGFYEPGYRDGGKLHLKMMCLGKNWDPQKREYGEKREIDNTKPPLIPSEFHQMVKGAIEASRLFLSEHSKSIDLGHVLPSMSPNICLVNFYTKSGRLGLHQMQDKDETKESIERGLPAVSFSIGDSAEFLYGDQADPEKVNKVVLESGDVLIFGGKSRLVFHGVTSILAETAPNALLQETGLRPGRLNLTFRELVRISTLFHTVLSGYDIL